MQNLLAGCFTLQDDLLFKLLNRFYDIEKIRLEPSALAGMVGPTMLWQSESGQDWLVQHQLKSVMQNANHLIWATGGGMLPDNEFEAYYQQGGFVCR